MKNMNRCKRVSFSSNGSMVETLIIDDFPDTQYHNEAHDYTDGSIIKHSRHRHSSGDVQATPTDVHPYPHHTADDKKHVTIKITDASDDDGQSSSGDTAEYPRSDSPTSSKHSGEWPVKRSQSIDSRDNPFLPGGNLSKEAEDILSRATIIRDKFILRDDAGATSEASPEIKTKSPQNGSPKARAVEEPVTETMTTEVVQNTEASVVPNSDTSETRHKENGQLETENSLTPGSVKVDIVEDSKDRKKQKKCCTVM